MPTSAEGNAPFIVFVKDEGLYFTYLNGGEEVMLHKRYKGKEFSYPIISKTGDYIAYTYGEDLCVFDFEKEEYKKIAEKIVS